MHYMRGLNNRVAMAQTFDSDILICGAGAAGLTLAIDLARRHAAFRIIDQIGNPFQGSRGKGIQPRSQEIFEDLGILDRVVAAGGVYPPQREYREDGSFEESVAVAVTAATAAEPYQIPLLIPQFLTERVMRERLAELGHSVEYGCALMGFAQDAESVTVRLANPRGEKSFRVRYLVGADGGGSFVRHALEIGFPGKTLGVRAIVADVILEGLGRDAWHRFNEGSMEKQMSLCPLAGTDLFQLQAPLPLEGDVDLSAEGLTLMIMERTGRSEIVIHSVSWASAFNMNARLADRYRDGRIFIAGDAAHIHPPTGGQGLNTSLQDAYNIGWKLAAVLNGAPDTLLDTYEEERRPIAAQMLGLATKLLESQKHGNRRRGREVHQLDIGYPESSLAFEQPQREDGVGAGDRAPDAPVRSSGGQRTRLFNLYKGPHWTLLGYEVEDHPAFAARAGLHIHTVGSKGEIIDDAGYIRDGYGLVRGDWVLVRPDGYIGAIVSSSETAALNSYLDRIGLNSPEQSNRN
jgi:2-polyprenyl-6-methoxyphenol hydroxylase-like FAD-dependent oxidoreductase